jgi:hypothetical protein
MARKHSIALSTTLPHIDPFKSVIDQSFAFTLRELLRLAPDSDLKFVYSPEVRGLLPGGAPGWLFRALHPDEKRLMVSAYCAGDSVTNIARRLMRGRSTVADLLKGLGLYISPAVRDSKAVEECRKRVAEFLANDEVEQWYASWQATWRKRRQCAAIVKDEELAV